MPMIKAIQYYDVERTEREALEDLDWLRVQQGFLGGRVIAPTPAKPGWRVQAFFDAEGVDAKPGTVLIEGQPSGRYDRRGETRVVLIPESMARTIEFSPYSPHGQVRGKR